MKRFNCLIVGDGKFNEYIASRSVYSIKQLAPAISCFGIGYDKLPITGAIELFNLNKLNSLKKESNFSEQLLLYEHSILEAISTTNIQLVIIFGYTKFVRSLLTKIEGLNIPVFLVNPPYIVNWQLDWVDFLKKHVDVVLGFFPNRDRAFLNNDFQYKNICHPYYSQIEMVSVDRKDLGIEENINIVVICPGSTEAEASDILSKLWNSIARYRHNHTKFYVSLDSSLNYEKLKNQSDFDLPKNVASAIDKLINSELGSIEVNGVNLFKGAHLELLSIADICVVGSGCISVEASYRCKNIIPIISSRKLLSIYSGLSEIKSLINQIYGYEKYKELFTYSIKEDFENSFLMYINDFLNPSKNSKKIKPIGSNKNYGLANSESMFNNIAEFVKKFINAKIAV